MSKSDVEQSSDSEGNDATAATKPTLWQRFKAHMKKWWWVYLIAFIVIVLVTVLPIIYVGIPHFANKYINDYDYDYTGLVISNPRPTAFHVKQKKLMNMGGGFSGSGHLSAFNASIRVPDTDEEFAVFPVPQIDFNGGATLDIDQDLDLSCVDCLADIAVKAATNKSFAVLATGHPDLKLGALPTAHLNIHKTLDMNGYNVTEFVNENGAFNVTSLDLLDPPVNGYNFNATISVRNPTPFSVEMGHVTFNLTMGGDELGYVDLPNLKLEENISDNIVLGNVDKSKLIQEALLGDGTGATVTIGVRGHSCDYNGQDIPYFSAAIRAVSANATIDLLNYASSLLG
ncbi:hypothetical protein N7532_006056 [Penicillium argentinense]|uniref:Uncharacterized protein n=1 Tax=Penicillium argentinense TaxID=1131581 RepID=A0A9W9FFC8_9EURO|nr:uncharacterized protein N7532_006056 [Penicillium argentinense]KAJ5099055.1 hypothetical protein N7532_006056 [Penicillium argentinense]